MDFAILRRYFGRLVKTTKELIAKIGDHCHWKHGRANGQHIFNWMRNILRWPKFRGFIVFPWKGKYSFFSNNWTLFANSVQKKTQRIRGIKGRSTELKFIRLEKGKEGSEVSSRDWNISRQLGSLTDRNKNSWWIGRQAMDKRCDRGVWGKRLQFLISGNLPLNMYRASHYPKRKVSFSPYAFD